VLFFLLPKDAPVFLWRVVVDLENSLFLPVALGIHQKRWRPVQSEAPAFVGHFKADVVASIRMGMKLYVIIRCHIPQIL
jgi:hypothetical protein